MTETCSTPPRPRLLVFGDINLDTVVLHREPLAPGSDSRARIVSTPGGSAANVAVWAARLGAAVGFFGQVGDDLVGSRLREGLAAEGVAVDPPAGGLLCAPGEPTGTIIVNVHDGERTMVTDRGANLTVPADLVTREALAQSEWLHLTAYSLFETGPREAALRALSLCRELGRPFSVDPSSYRLLREYGCRRFLGDIEGVSVFFPNRDEARELTGLGDPRQAALALAGRLESGGGAVGPTVVVVKLGAEGCVLAVAGRVETFAPEGGVPYDMVAVPREGAPRDPTGAGDAFAAGFLTAYLANAREPAQLALAVRAGLSTAARVVNMLGAR